MPKKLLISLLAFALVGVVALGAGLLAAGEDGGLPQPVTAESACPAVGCASGECHGYEAVPEPDGVHEMACPEASCASVECHAWETMSDGYRAASDASLNLWIIAPVALVLGLVLIVVKVK